MKKCPFCGEEIQDAAVKCKHCKEWIEKKPAPQTATSSQRQQIHSQKSPIGTALYTKENIADTDAPPRPEIFPIILIIVALIINFGHVIKQTQYLPVVVGYSIGYCGVWAAISYVIAKITARKNPAGFRLHFGWSFVILSLLIPYLASIA